MSASLIEKAALIEKVKQDVEEMIEQILHNDRDRNRYPDLARLVKMLQGNYYCITYTVNKTKKWYCGNCNSFRDCSSGCGEEEIIGTQTIQHFFCNDNDYNTSVAKFQSMKDFKSKKLDMDTEYDLVCQAIRDNNKVYEYCGPSKPPIFIFNWKSPLEIDYMFVSKQDFDRRYHHQYKPYKPSQVFELFCNEIKDLCKEKTGKEDIALLDDFFLKKQQEILSLVSKITDANSKMHNSEEEAKKYKNLANEYIHKMEREQDEVEKNRKLLETFMTQYEDITGNKYNIPKPKEKKINPGAGYWY